MIEGGFAYLSLLVVISSSIVYIQEQYRWRVFEYLPAIVILYFLVMTLSTFEVWSRNQEINSAYKDLKSNLLPAMIFLMLLQADIRKILRVGRRILLTFALASFSISLGLSASFRSFCKAFRVVSSFVLVLKSAEIRMVKGVLL